MELPESLALPVPGARLRGLRADDWMLEQALSRVDDVPGWTLIPAHLSDEDAQARVTRSLALQADGRGGRFTVELAGVPVGTAGLALRPDRPTVYYAFLPAGRGKGLATAAARALAGWALDRGAPLVEAGTMLENTASERVLQRAGFHRAGFDVEPDGVTVTRWVTTSRDEPTDQ